MQRQTAPWSQSPSVVSAPCQNDMYSCIYRLLDVTFASNTGVNFDQVYCSQTSRIVDHLHYLDALSEGEATTNWNKVKGLIKVIISKDTKTRVDF